MSISTIGITKEEIVGNPSDFGIKKSINTKPFEEYQIGKNKGFYPLNIRSDKFTYKYDINLLIPKDKLLQLDNIYKDQIYNRILKYDIDSGNYNSVFLNFDSPFTEGYSKCIIENLEVTGSIIRKGKLLYKCNLTLIEILL